MASLRARLLNLVFRLEKRKTARRRGDELVVNMRRSLERGGGKVPAGVEVEPQTVGGVACERITWGAVDASRLLVYFHGGGYVAGSPRSHRDFAARMSKAAGLPVLLVDYRLAPEHRWPAQLDDAVSVYEALLADGIAPLQLAVGGDSAGGHLTLALLLKLRDSGRPLPAAAFCYSPWADLSHSGESFARNAKADPMIPPAMLEEMAELVAPGVDRREPLLSPVFGDYRGLPPLLVFVADTELLLDDAARVRERAEAADVPVEYCVWNGVAHAFPIAAMFVPEGRAAIARTAAFLHSHLAA